MHEIINYSIDIVLFTLYIILTVALASMPLWGFKLIESRFTTKQKALKTSSVSDIVGFQIIAPPMADHLLYRVGSALESALVDRWGSLLIAEVPEL